MGIITTVFIRWQLFWMQFCILLRSLFVRNKPTSLKQHKLLIIGDSLGLGVGDTFSVQEGSGRDATIRNLIESTSRPTKQEGWKVVNHSISGTTSDDWRPDNRIGVSQGNKNHFESVMQSRNGDAEIVLLVVGLQDIYKGAAKNVPQRTLENISSIAHELKARDKFCIIPTIPINPDWSEEQKQSARERNSLLREWIQGLSKEDAKYIALGPAWDASRYQQTKNYWIDGVHWNWHNYDRAARDLWPILQLKVTKVEWRSLHQLIAPKK